MRVSRGIGLLISALAATAALVGCDGGSGSGDSGTAGTGTAGTGLADSTVEEILEQTRAAAAAASSFRMKGDITSDGSKINLDIRFAKDAGDVSGTISAEGSTFEVLVVDGKAYLKGDQATWASFAGDGPAQLLAGKYILIPEGEQGFSDLLTFADPSSFLDEGLQPGGTVTKTGVKDVNGTSAIGLFDDAEEGGTLYVAVEGPAYPLRIEGPPGQGAIDLTEWNEPVELTVPPADQVVDLSSLDLG